MRVVLRLSAVVPVAFLLAVPAAGQRPDTLVLEPVVVTANRVPTPRNALSATVTVLAGDDLRARGIATVLDALRLVPGAQVVQTGSFGGQTSVFLRGGESDYTKVLLDGVPVNEPGGAFNWAALTTDAIDRIEIVRGPVSVLYGSDAVAGIVQIFTRGGTRGGENGTTGTLSAEAGRYGTIRTAGEVAAQAPGIGYALGVSRLTTDGLYAQNGGYRNVVANGRLRVTPDDRSDASLSVRYGDDLFHNPINCFEQPTDVNKQQSGKGPAIGLEAGRTLSSRVEARVNVAHSATDTRFDDDADGGSDPCGAFHTRDRVRRTGAGARINLRAGSGGRALITAGVETEWQRWRGSLRANRDNRAVFAQLLTGAAAGSGPLSITVGARLDHNAQFGSHWTGRVGVAYRAALTRLRAAVGTGYKEPTFIENFSTGFAIGDPNLKPERSFGWEMGVEHAWRGAPVSLWLTYFDQEFRDLILYAFAPTPPDSDNFYNAGLAEARGVEAGATARLWRGLGATATYTHTYTRDAQGTGLRLLRRPSHAGTLGLAYRFAGEGSVTLDALFVGDRDDMDFISFTRVTLPPRTRVDAAVRWPIVRGAAGGRTAVVTMRIENLLDAAYEDAKNYRTSRRAVYLGGEVRFGR
jgi:vitamin B12 transporter